MRRWLRRIGWFALSLVAFLILALGAARLFLQGPLLARMVTRYFVNPGITGHVELDSVRWRFGTVPFVDPIEVEVRGLRVKDRPPGGGEVVVLEAARARGHLHLGPLIGPRHDIVVEDLVVEDAFCLAEQYLLDELGPDGRPRDAVGLLHAFWPRKRRPPRADARPPTGPIYVVRDLTLERMHLILDMNTWEAELWDVSARHAWVRSAPGPTHEQADFTFEAAPHAGLGHLVLIPGGAEDPTRGPVFVLLDVDAALTIQPGRQDFEYFLTARTADGARIESAFGALHHIYERDPRVPGARLHIEVADAGPMARRLSLGHVAGPSLRFTGNIAGSYVRPRITVEAEDAVLADVPDTRVDRARVTLADGVARIAELTVSSLGGQATVAGTVTLGDPEAPPSAPPAPPRFDVTVAVRRPIDAAPLAPGVPLGRYAGGTRVTGGLHVGGTADDVAVDRIGLTLGDARASGAVRVRGGVAELDGLTVSLAGATARASGPVDLARRRLDVSVALRASPLTPWLRRLGAPPVASGLVASGSVEGPLADPTVRARLMASGVPLAGTVTGNLTYQGGQLTVPRLAAAPLGGEIHASARLRLGGPGGGRILGLNVSGGNIDLSRAPGGWLGGVVRFRLDAEGPLSAPEAQLEAGADALALSGFPLGDAASQARLDATGLTLQSLHVGRPATGSLDVVGRVGVDGGLALELDLRRFALASVPLAGATGPALDGTAGLRATVGGTLDRPEVEGVLQLMGVVFRDTIFGNAPIALEPWPGGKLHFSGRLFQGKFELDGWLSLVPPFAMEARLDFRRVEIDEFAAEPMAALGAHGWVSGWAEVKWGRDFRAALHATEIQLSLDAEDDLGRPSPVEIASRGEVDVEFDGRVARLTHPIELRGGAGNSFRVSGYAGAQDMDLSLVGNVDLVLLGLYTRRWLESVRGEAVADVRVTGSPARPLIAGTLAIANASATPRGQDAELRIPEGRLVLATDRVSVDNLTLEVDRQRTRVSGEVTLAAFRPDRVRLDIRGRVAARLLELLAPRSVSGARGSARVALAVTGAAANPDIDGTLSFDGPFAFSPRGLRKDVVLTGGQVQFSNRAIALRALKGSVDDAALSLRGDRDRCDTRGFCIAVRLYQWQPVDVFLGVAIAGLSQNSQALRLELNTDVELTGDRDELQLRGRVEIVQGRYAQDYRWDRELFVPQRTGERAIPFWKGNRLLENLRLSLAIETTGLLAVKNNLASLTLEGNVQVIGTLSEPLVDGQIRILDGGTVKIPTLRPTFEVRSGQVTFSKLQRFPDETPYIDIASETPFTDLDERTHQVYLNIRGTLSRFQASLSTDTGLNTPQTILLLYANRSDANALMRGEGGTGRIQPGRDLTGTAQTGGVGGTADNLSKEFAGPILDNFIAGPVGNLLGSFLPISCFHVAPGTESIRFNACLKLVDRWSVDSEYEQTFSGGNGYRVTVKYEVQDDLYLEGLLQQRPQKEENKLTDDRKRVQLRWRYVIP